MSRAAMRPAIPIENNIIGLTAAGTAVLGNDEAGVADYSPGTLIGPGNVISANLIGVLISGASATGVVVRDNLIGTDSTGTADLGNAEDGVQIDNASGEHDRRRQPGRAGDLGQPGRASRSTARRRRRT